MFKKFLSDETNVSLSYFSLFCNDITNTIDSVIEKNKGWKRERRRKGFIDYHNKDIEIYCWGNNAYGELGIENMRDQHSLILFQLPKNFLQIKQIRCGRSHSLFVCKKGDCFSVGCNNLGQLGIGKSISSISELQKISIPKNTNNEELEELITGSDHCFAITKNRLTRKKEIYCWGDNRYGQLGIGNRENQYFPTVFKFEDDVKQIECGYNHTVLISEKKECYMFGLIFDKEKDYVYEIPKKIEMENYAFEKVIVGGEHNFAFTKNLKTNEREIYCWGRNYNDQIECYNDLEKNSSNLYRVNENHNQIDEIICGRGYSIFLNEKKEYFPFGSNKYGQLGLDRIVIPQQRMQNMATELFHIEKRKIKEIVPLMINIFITTEKEKNHAKKKIFIFGDNSCGQLGVGDFREHTNPVRLKIKGKKCLQIISGPCSYHVFAVFANKNKK